MDRASTRFGCRRSDEAGQDQPYFRAVGFGPARLVARTRILSQGPELIQGRVGTFQGSS
jgi:hypothetical protein